MTPAERRAALVERMLEAFANASGLGILPDEEEDEEWREDLVNGMSAAIDLALEEAAKVANSMYKKGQIGEDIAAAIRALKDGAS